MHIPDGFLSANTWVSTWIISIGGIGYCIKKLSKILREKMIPLMGVMSAFIFAVQMLNFPIAAGTSGHLLGGVLAAVLLGPYGGAVVLAVVLSIQCLVFQDGGLTALGANMFNMSFIGSMGGYVIYNSIRRIIGNNKGVLIGTAVASWLSVVLASVFCAVELAISGTSPLQVVLPAMALVHILIGIGEAIISVLVVSFILKIRPDLIYNSKGE
ncbi:MAG: energy-coupling factor ABC transporter permease [Candidatus Omnitrophica bacterium]|nr:energy-coupling factor ABC transporter permease [Candidatus Omnitrophota bacterium]